MEQLSTPQGPLIPYCPSDAHLHPEVVHSIQIHVVINTSNIPRTYFNSSQFKTDPTREQILYSRTLELEPEPWPGRRRTLDRIRWREQRLFWISCEVCIDRHIFCYLADKERGLLNITRGPIESKKKAGATLNPHRLKSHLTQCS